MRISITDAQSTFVPANCPEINAPFVQFSTNDLTGDEGTVFITVSVDHQNTWQNGIFMNTRVFKLKVDGGELSCVSKSGRLPTFRKTGATNSEEVVSKLNRYIDKVEVEENTWFDDFNYKASRWHY